MTGSNVSIQPAGPQDAPTCESILRALADWFGLEDAIVAYRRDIEHMDTWVARDGDTVVGFITANRRFPDSAEIQVLGVLRPYHRRGIGALLVRHLEAVLRGDGVRFLQVKTLSPSRENEDYARTRAFYMGVGFVPLEEFPTLWDPANPALQFIKAL